MGCSLCKNCLHIKCSYVKTTQTLTHLLEKDSTFIEEFICQKCLDDTLPFNRLNDLSLLLLMSDMNETLFELNEKCKSFEEIYHGDVSFNPELDPDNNFYHINKNDLSAYYLDDQFNSKFGDGSFTNGLSIIHFNCRSINAHFVELTHYLDSLTNSFDVIALTETWLQQDEDEGENDDDADYVYDIDGYKRFTCSRANKRGGGVAIYAGFTVRS